MDRQEAIAVLKEMDESRVALMPPDADEVIMMGYQLHLKQNLILWIGDALTIFCIGMVWS